MVAGGTYTAPATVTSNAAAADADGQDSVDVIVTTSGNTITVRGTMLDQPAQPQGGGLNLGLLVAVPGGALANNANVPVQFVLGMQTGGSFRSLGNVEAATTAPATSTQKAHTLMPK